MDRPRLVVSACLLGEKVRYDGRSAEDEFVLELSERCEVIPVCPEVSVGLGVPRDKIIVYIDEEMPKLSQPSTGRDLTKEMERFSKSFLDQLPPVDGFILKSKSPSCGVSRTKTYRDPRGEKFLGLTKGLFALEVLRRYPHYPIEDEIRLRDEKRRLLFLAKLFALFKLRTDPQSLKDLLEYLKIWSPGRLRKFERSLDRKALLKALENLPIGVLKEVYLSLLKTP